MKTLAVYSGSPDLDYFLKLEELAASYKKVYVLGRNLLSGINMFGDLENVFFTESMGEVTEQATDILFYHDSVGMEEKIQYFAERGKKIYLYGVTMDIEEEYREKVFALSAEEAPQKKVVKRLYELPCPVVTVMGISEKCERHKLFIEVSHAIEEQGYGVMKISGEPVSQMDGCIRFPEAVYAGRPLAERTRIFNHFLYRKVKEEKPDIVMIDVPGGILNQSVLEYTCDGEYAYMAGNAVDTDASLLAIPAHEINEAFVKELKEVCRQRFSANVAGIAMSCVGCKINMEENKTNYFTLPAGFVKEKYIGEEKYIVPVKTLHGGGEYFAEHLLAILSDAG